MAKDIAHIQKTISLQTLSLTINTKQVDTPRSNTLKIPSFATKRMSQSNLSANSSVVVTSTPRESITELEIENLDTFTPKASVSDLPTIYDKPSIVILASDKSVVQNVGDCVSEKKVANSINNTPSSPLLMDDMDAVIAYQEAVDDASG